MQFERLRVPRSPTSALPDPIELGRRLRAACDNHDDGLAIYDEFARNWLMGACWVLAEALRQSLGSRHATLWMLVRDGKPLHVLTRYRDHYYDGSGAKTHKALMKWAFDCTLEPFDELRARQEGDIVCPQTAVAATVDLLHAKVLSAPAETAEALPVRRPRPAPEPAIEELLAYSVRPKHLYAEHLPAVDPLPLSKADLEVFAVETSRQLRLQSFELMLTTDGAIRLSSLIVPRDGRGEGRGTTAMEDLTAFADAHGRRLVLTPAIQDRHHGTTSQSRLIAFYKRFGFALNKGRHKDFRYMDMMIREPQK